MRVLGVLSIRAFWAASQLEEEDGVVLERTMKAGNSRLGPFFLSFFFSFPFLFLGFGRDGEGRMYVCVSIIG